MAGFLWQHDGWPAHLHWDARTVLEPLSHTRRAQGHLLGRVVGLGIDLSVELHADAVVLEAMATSAVEGEHLDPEGVRSSVAEQLGLATAGRVGRARHVDGLVAMLVDATARHHEPLTSERLHGWHAGLFPTGHSGIRPITVAGWRTGVEPMRVLSGGLYDPTVHFEAPASQAVPGEMDAFLRWWSHDSNHHDGLVRAAIAHLWFVTIHPYDDGNGRMTRALTDMALAQDEGTGTRAYSMSALIESHRSAYYQQLERAQRGDGDITDWIVWFLGALRGAIETAETRVDTVFWKARFWQRCGAVAMTERQLKAVHRLLSAGPDGFEGGLSTRKYAHLARVSRSTAQRELADLVKKGVLVPLAAGGRSTAYALNTA